MVFSTLSPSVTKENLNSTNIFNVRFYRNQTNHDSIYQNVDSWKGHPFALSISVNFFDPGYIVNVKIKSFPFLIENWRKWSFMDYLSKVYHRFIALASIFFWIRTLDGLKCVKFIYSLFVVYSYTTVPRRAR